MGTLLKLVRLMKNNILIRYSAKYKLVHSALDQEFYLENYPFVSKSHLHPVAHYLKIGSKRGFMPRADFDPNIYLRNYPDVRASGTDPFLHYLKYGKDEGRTSIPQGNSRIGHSFEDYTIISSDFDRDYYLRTYKDVAHAGLDPIGHYLSIGWKEGRKPRANFDTSFYISRYPDVTKSRLNPFVHYMKYGRAENRMTSQHSYESFDGRIHIAASFRPAFKDNHSESIDQLFDGAWYLSRYPDVRLNGAEPRLHYLRYGAREGRDPHPLFSTQFYLSQVKNSRAALRNPLAHYLQYGSRQGISPHPLFDRLWYRAHNSDIVATGMDEFCHFILIGDKQGRTSHPHFDPLFYLQNNPGVAASRIGPLRHFVETGGQEGRNPHPMFDCQYYKWLYPEIAEKRINPLVHYLMQPRDARRHPHPLFDGAVHRLTSALARETTIDPLTDYVEFRSSLDPKLLARNTTCIPTPARVALPKRRPKQNSAASRALVSLLLFAYKFTETHLAETVNSVRAQTHSNWELIILDNGSSTQTIDPMIERIVQLDPRIRCESVGKDSKISHTDNPALRSANGQFFILLGNDAVLMHDAIEEAVSALLEAHADVVYSDHTYITAQNSLETIFYKPDWSPTLLSGVMYVDQFVAIRREVALLVSSNFWFSHLQIFEFMLRVSERTRKIAHVPKILYHVRGSLNGIANDPNSKPIIESLQTEAVNAHFIRTGFQGKAKPHEHLPYRLAIVPRPRNAYPTVDIVIRGDRTAERTSQCIKMLKEAFQTDENIMVLAMHSDLTETSALARGREVRQSTEIGSSAILPPSPLAAALTQAMSVSSGRYMMFVDPLIEVTDKKWLHHLLLYAERDDVAFVAPHVYRNDDGVAAAGLLITEKGLSPAMCHLKLGQDGYAGSLACAREVSALPAAMIMTNRAALDALGGFDPCFSTPHYIFGDAAVRASKLGYRNIAIPALMMRVENDYKLIDADDAMDTSLFQDIHADAIRKGDPFYNILSQLHYSA